jgi:hypothetical protein
VCSGDGLGAPDKNKLWDTRLGTFFCPARPNLFGAVWGTRLEMLLQNTREIMEACRQCLIICLLIGTHVSGIEENTESYEKEAAAPGATRAMCLVSWNCQGAGKSLDSNKMNYLANSSC